MCVLFVCTLHTVEYTHFYILRWFDYLLRQESLLLELLSNDPRENHHRVCELVRQLVLERAAYEDDMENSVALTRKSAALTMLINWLFLEWHATSTKGNTRRPRPRRIAPRRIHRWCIKMGVIRPSWLWTKRVATTTPTKEDDSRARQLD